MEKDFVTDFFGTIKEEEMEEAYAKGVWDQESFDNLMGSINLLCLVFRKGGYNNYLVKSVNPRLYAAMNVVVEAYKRLDEVVKSGGCYGCPITNRKEKPQTASNDSIGCDENNIGKSVVDF